MTRMLKMPNCLCGVEGLVPEQHAATCPFRIANIPAGVDPDRGPWSNRPRAPMTREEFERFEEQVVEALNPQPLGRTWRVVRRPIWEIDDDETGEVRWTHEYEVREVSPEGYELVLNTCRDLGQALVWAQAHVSQQEEWEVTWTGENTATTRKMIG